MINKAGLSDTEKRLLKWWVKKTYKKTSRFSTDSNTSKLKHLFEYICGHYIYEDDAKKMMLEWGYAPKDKTSEHWIFKLRFCDPDMRYSNGVCLTTRDYLDAGELGTILRDYAAERKDD